MKLLLITFTHEAVAAFRAEYGYISNLTMDAYDAYHAQLEIWAQTTPDAASLMPAEPPAYFAELFAAAMSGQA